MTQPPATSEGIRACEAIGAPSPSARQDNILLEVAGLTKRYGNDFALADVTFGVREGEVLGIIGPNGAGKTTLLEALAGVLPADAGRVSWRGVPVSPARRRDAMFYLPDGVRPWHDQHVEQALAFFAGVYRRPETHVADAIVSVGLEPVLRKRIVTLSKGYGRRLMLALALITPHPLLLMDEPFDGLDLKQTRDIMAVLRAVAAHGRTLVLSIHQLLDAERICDRLVLLANGRVRGVGTLDELRAQTQVASGGLEDVFLALT